MWIVHLLPAPFQGYSRNILCDIPHLLLPKMSDQELIQVTTIRTYLTWTSRDLSFMFVVYGSDLIVKGVVCVRSVDLGSSWLVLVIFLNDSRGSTLFISLYYHLSKRHMMSVHVWALSVFVFIIVKFRNKKWLSFKFLALPKRHMMWFHFWLSLEPSFRAGTNKNLTIS